MGVPKTQAQFVLEMAIRRKWNVCDVIETYYPHLSLEDKCLILDEIETITEGKLNHENHYNSTGNNLFVIRRLH